MTAISDLAHVLNISLCIYILFVTYTLFRSVCDKNNVEIRDVGGYSYEHIFVAVRNSRLKKYAYDDKYRLDDEYYGITVEVEPEGSYGG